MPDRADGLRKVFCTAVLDIVSINRSDNHMVQSQRFNRMRDATRLERVKIFGRLARCNVAKGASARADLAHDHHGRVTLAPAFADVWTARFFANGDKLVVAHDLGRVLIAFSAGRFYTDPVGFFRLRTVRTPLFFRVPLFWDF